MRLMGPLGLIGLMSLISPIGPMSLIGLMSLISLIGPMSLMGLMGWLSPGLFHAAGNDAPCCPLSRLLEHRPALAGASARACWSIGLRLLERRPALAGA